MIGMLSLASIFFSQAKPAILSGVRYYMFWAFCHFDVRPNWRAGVIILPMVGGVLSYFLALLSSLCDWTSSPTFAALVEVCSFVFRPFGYALGIIEARTLEEETSSTSHQLNI